MEHNDEYYEEDEEFVEETLEDEEQELLNSIRNKNLDKD